MRDDGWRKGLFTGSEDLSKTQISTPRFGDDAEGGLFVGWLGS